MCSVCVQIQFVLRLCEETLYAADVIFSGSDVLSVVNKDEYAPVLCSAGSTMSQAGIK
jgi:hypothetical protein